MTEKYLQLILTLHRAFFMEWQSGSLLFLPELPTNLLKEL